MFWSFTFGTGSRKAAEVGNPNGPAPAIASAYAGNFFLYASTTASSSHPLIAGSVRSRAHPSGTYSHSRKRGTTRPSSRRARSFADARNLTDRSGAVFDRDPRREVQAAPEALDLSEPGSAQEVLVPRRRDGYQHPLEA